MSQTILEKKSANDRDQSNARVITLSKQYSSIPLSVSIGNINPLPSPDYLYHLGLNTDMNLPDIFGDIRCVLVMGSADRALNFATDCAGQLDTSCTPLGKTERYSLFKVGPVLFGSHGIGMPSASVFLHELVKLLRYAGCLSDVPIIRSGTSGGIGIPPGSIVITTNALNGELQEYYRLPILGKAVLRSSDGFSQKLVDDLYDCALEEMRPNSSANSSVYKGIENHSLVVKGKTMSCDCFYEGQGRMDGAICEYTEADKLAFLQQCYELGVRNIEMEALLLGAFGKKLNIPVATICVTLINRLDGDQVSMSRDHMDIAVNSLQNIIMRYVLKCVCGKEVKPRT